MYFERFFTPSEKQVIKGLPSAVQIMNQTKTYSTQFFIYLLREA